MVGHLKHLRLLDYRTWKTKTRTFAGPDPQEGDIVLVKDGQAVGQRVKIGRITEIFTTSANVMCTPKNHVSKFKLDNLVLICKSSPVSPTEDRDLEELLHNN